MATVEVPFPVTTQVERANFLNLVIIDDERAVREACREVAQSLGFNAFVADSAEHAYRMIESHSADVVLLDLKLPGADGLEAIQQIKLRRPDAVVVVVTGYATVQSAVQAMKSGAYDYVTKPCLDLIFSRSMRWIPPFPSMQTVPLAERDASSRRFKPRCSAAAQTQ